MAAPPKVPSVPPPVSTAPPTAPTPAPMAVFWSWRDMPAQALRPMTKVSAMAVAKPRGTRSWFVFMKYLRWSNGGLGQRGGSVTLGLLRMAGRVRIRCHCTQCKAGPPARLCASAPCGRCGEPVQGHACKNREILQAHHALCAQALELNPQRGSGPARDWLQS